MKRILPVFASLSLVGLFLAQPRQTKATTVTAVVCANNSFPCNAPLDSGVRSNLIGVLGSNRYALLPFSFSDVNATFNGNILVTDYLGRYIYLWGGGVATNVLNSGFFLDVAISQNYVTAPGLWGFAGFNNGVCNAAATAAGSGNAGLPFVNGVPVLPAAGNTACPAFVQTFGPKLQGVGGITNMTAAAQFFFGPGVLGQAITLPWGEDFPDPSLPIPDPNHLLPGTTAAPEPSSLLLLSAAILMTLAWGIRRRRMAQA